MSSTQNCAVVAGHHTTPCCIVCAKCWPEAPTLALCAATGWCIVIIIILCSVHNSDTHSHRVINEDRDTWSVLCPELGNLCQCAECDVMSPVLQTQQRHTQLLHSFLKLSWAQHPIISLSDHPTSPAASHIHSSDNEDVEQRTVEKSGGIRTKSVNDP